MALTISPAELVGKHPPCWCGPVRVLNQISSARDKESGSDSVGTQGGYHGYCKQSFRRQARGLACAHPGGRGPGSGSRRPRGCLWAGAQRCPCKLHLALPCRAGSSSAYSSRDCAGKRARKCAGKGAGECRHHTGTDRLHPTTTAERLSERAERSSETTGRLAQGTRGASKRAKRVFARRDDRDDGPSDPENPREVADRR